MKESILFIAASMLFLVSCQGEQKRVQPPVPGGDESGGYKKEDVLGKVMPAWEEGFLDIHFINTTSGEAAFIILPDGTQFLVDAAGSQVATGAVNSTTNTQIRQRWDPTKTNTLYGEFISDYIRKCMVWTSNDKIDYVLLTHLHNDHFGGASGLPKSKLGGNYTQQSLPYIMDEFPIGLLMDRGYPDYMYPFDNQKLASNKDNIVNYVNAVKWHVANKGLKAEQFKVGSASQIKLVRDPSKYPTCKVRNLACNGEIWTGANENTIKTFPDTAAITYANPASIASADNCPPENITSACFLLSYGKFDYFGGADLQFNGASTYKWKDTETAVAKVAGVVDVMKADHHGVDNTNGTNDTKGFVAMKYLCPRVWIVNSWTDGHPRPDVLKSVADYASCAGMDMYVTNLSSGTQSAASSYMNRVKGKDGHVVVRVTNKGSNYYIFVLNDSDRSMKVHTFVGPYVSK